MMTSKALIYTIAGLCCIEFFSTRGPFTTAAPTASCQPIWTSTRDVAVDGPISATGATGNPAKNVAACEAACLAFPTCKSIDFLDEIVPGEDIQQCILYTVQRPTKQLFGNTHYDLTRPAGNCATTAKTPSAPITTTKKASAPITTTKKSSAPITTTKKPSAPITTTKKPSAPITTTQKPAALITTSSKKIATSATTRGNPVTAGNCQPIWTKFSDFAVVPTAFAHGSGATIFEACQAACLADPTCKSIDFLNVPEVQDPVQQCLLYTVQGPLISSPSTDHYNLARPAGNCGAQG